MDKKTGRRAWERADYAKNPDKYRRRSRLARANGSFKRWYAMNKEADWERSLKRRYGITAAEYQRLYEAQDGVCAICEEPETAKGRGGEIKRLAVDHCHKTGRVRSLLCDACNRLLGYAREDHVVLRRAISYLNHHSDATASSV